MVSALTGHKPGSPAFARYREIDDDMKQEMVDAIDQSFELTYNNIDVYIFCI